MIGGDGRSGRPTGGCWFALPIFFLAMSLPLGIVVASILLNHFGLINCCQDAHW